MRYFSRENFNVGGTVRHYTLYNNVGGLQKRHFDRIGVACFTICPLGTGNCFLRFLKIPFAWQLIAVWLLT